MGTRMCSSSQGCLPSFVARVAYAEFARSSWQIRKGDNSLTFAILGLTTFKNLCTTYKAIPSCVSYFTDNSYHQGNSSGHELPHRAWHKLDVSHTQIFVELTHQNLGYSPSHSVRSG